ncbi:hypothetical protein CLCR_09138 [Cladophialophora carrionii]|uniref:Uncharacterized protein n=1 Tax=Cladophialophora carrionii TaxID=86049 RepID=A0A1C1CSM8_9EURO|nr:hypothetical protein CLCR_09138 [Cladophialophora carrionii]
MSLKQLEIMIPQLLHRHQKSLQDQTISEDLRRSLVIVQWAAHIYWTSFGTGFLIPPSNPKPSVDAPYAVESWQHRLTDWTPYPLQRETVQLPLHALYHHVCELYLIVPDAQALAFAGYATMNAGEKLDAARTIDARFMEWYGALPPRFQFEQPGFVVVPTTIDLAYGTSSVMAWQHRMTDMRTG